MAEAKTPWEKSQELTDTAIDQYFKNIDVSPAAEPSEKK